MGDDLEIKVLVDSNHGQTSLNGTVRIIGQYTDATRLESIGGLEFLFSDSNSQPVVVSEETASQIQGTYLHQVGMTNGDYRPYDTSVSYFQIDRVLQVGGAERDWLHGDGTGILLKQAA